MPDPGRRPKAIALMSGGLDSTLAAKIVQDHGVEVVGLHLVSPFGCREDVEKSARQIGVPLLYRDKGEAYLDLLENPRYGYGRHMNPCIDCRIFMFQIADVVRQDAAADFIVTGEVLGQRPMSQQRQALALIDRQSPLERLVLRPLSAQRFPATIPEEKGWVDRNRLLHIAGRGRKEQMDLAEQHGIVDYPSPAGGCLLTEARFSSRLKDFFAHDGKGITGELRMARSSLLRVGRHFRLSPETKIVVGRSEPENRELEKLWAGVGGVFLRPHGFEGPSVVVVGPFTDEARHLAGAMIVRYSKPGTGGTRHVAFRTSTGDETFPVETTVSEDELDRLRL